MELYWTLDILEYDSCILDACVGTIFEPSNFHLNSILPVSETAYAAHCISKVAPACTVKSLLMSIS